MVSRNSFESLLSARKRGTNAESALQRTIVHALRFHGLLVKRIPAQGVLRNAGTPQARMTRSELAGMPDLLVLGPCGRTAWLEVKTETGRLSQLQDATIRELSRLGHIAAVVRSPEAALEVLRANGFFQPCRQEITHESLPRGDKPGVPARRRKPRRANVP